MIRSLSIIALVSWSLIEALPTYSSCSSSAASTSCSQRKVSWAGDLSSVREIPRLRGYSKASDLQNSIFIHTTIICKLQEPEEIMEYLFDLEPFKVRMILEMFCGSDRTLTLRQKIENILIINDDVFSLKKFIDEFYFRIHHFVQLNSLAADPDLIKRFPNVGPFIRYSFKLAQLSKSTLITRYIRYYDRKGRIYSVNFMKAEGKGVTPIMTAQDNGDEKAIKLLESKGAN